MVRWSRGWAALAACMVVAAQAEPAPDLLDHPSLARCANQVLQLRTESPQLSKQNFMLETRREEIMRRGMNLQAEAAQLDFNDLRGGLDIQQRQQQHNADVAQLNAQVEQLKTDIGSLNLLKADYDQHCANRSYRRRDLDTMPPAARDAMRAGMNDVSVPYLDPARSQPLR